MCRHALITVLFALAISATACTGQLEFGGGPPGVDGAAALDPALPGGHLDALDTPGADGASDSGERACVDDFLEENDDALSTTPIPGAGNIDGLMSCPGDQDWFEYVLLDQDLLTVEAFFSHVEGNIDLSLVDVLGNSLDASATGYDDELMTFTSLGNTTVRVIVDLTEDLGVVDGNPYDFGFSIVNPITCRDDSREDDDSQAAASVVTGAGYYGGSVACDADTDWWAIPLEADDELTLDILFSHAEGDVNVQLLDASGGVLDTGTSVSDHERVSYQAAGTEQVFLVVDLLADAGSWAGNEYDVEVEILNRFVCVDDAFEDNDVQATAVPIAASGMYGDLVQCGAGDRDWYSFDLLTGQVLSVEAMFAQDAGDIDLGLEDAAGNLLVDSATANSPEFVEWVSTADETVYLNVELYQDDAWLAGNTYELIVLIEDAFVCQDDLFEDDDEPALATQIPDDLGLLGGVACAGDVDWFRIPLVVGELMTAVVSFDNAEGDIDLVLEDPLGVLVDSSSTVTDTEAVSWTASGDDVVYLGVELVADAGAMAGNSYELDIAIDSTLFCIDDDFEENDLPGIATVLPGTGLVSGLTMCDGDADWFEVELAAAESLVVNALFDDAEGDIDLELFDVLGNSLASSATTTDNEQVTYEPVSPQTVRVAVTLTADDGVIAGTYYELSVNLVDGLLCAEDGLEENDDLATATPIYGPGGLTGLGICPDDEDWFSYQVGAGDEATFDVLFSHGDGDVDISLQDAAGTVLASSTSNTDDEQIVYTGAVTEMLYLVVEHTTESDAQPGTTYDLQVAVSNATACIDDGLEDDDTALTAALLEGAGTYADLRSCELDEDWYDVGVMAGELITVDALFSHAEGDIDVTLWDAAGSVLDTSATVDDDEQVSWTASVDTLVRVQVVLTADAGVELGNAYDLVIAVP